MRLAFKYKFQHILHLRYILRLRRDGDVYSVLVFLFPMIFLLKHLKTLAVPVDLSKVVNVFLAQGSFRITLRNVTYLHQLG